MQELNLPSINMDVAEDGKWFVFNNDISFKVARDGNPKHKRALQSKFKQMTKLRERGDIARLEHMNTEMQAQYILRDWKGIKDDKGKEVTYSMEVGLTVLSNPRYAQVKEFIQDCSADSAEFEEDLIDTKNS